MAVKKNAKVTAKKRLCVVDPILSILPIACKKEHKKRLHGRLDCVRPISTIGPCVGQPCIRTVGWRVPLRDLVTWSKKAHKFLSKAKPRQHVVEVYLADAQFVKA